MYYTYLYISNFPGASCAMHKHVTCVHYPAADPGKVFANSQCHFCLQVQHKLTEEGVYPALAESIADCLSVRREELHEKMVQDSCAISHAHLVDFDWQVKVQ